MQSMQRGENETLVANYQKSLHAACYELCQVPVQAVISQGAESGGRMLLLQSLDGSSPFKQVTVRLLSPGPHAAEHYKMNGWSRTRYNNNCIMSPINVLVPSLLSPTERIPLTYKSYCYQVSLSYHTFLEFFLLLLLWTRNSRLNGFGGRYHKGLDTAKIIKQLLKILSNKKKQ